MVLEVSEETIADLEQALFPRQWIYQVQSDGRVGLVIGDAVLVGRS